MLRAANRIWKPRFEQSLFGETVSEPNIGGLIAPINIIATGIRLSSNSTTNRHDKTSTPPSGPKQHFFMTRARAKTKAFKHHNRTETDRASESEYLYGYHPIIAALKTNRRQFHELYVRDSLYKLLAEQKYHSALVQQIHQEILDRDMAMVPVNKARLDKLTQYAMHQGLCVKVTPYVPSAFTPKDLDVSESGNTESAPLLWLLIDRVKDPMNVGALLRNSVFFGTSLILTTPQCSKLSPVVSKASSGAMESALIRRVSNPARLLCTLQSSGWNIVGAVCDSTNSRSLNDLSKSIAGNTIVIIGSEGFGIDEDIKEHCTHFLHIQPYPTCPDLLDSLNVSVASGIILHSLSSHLPRRLPNSD